MKLHPATTNAQMLDNMMKRLGNRQAAPLRAQLLYELNRKVDQYEAGPLLPWFLEKNYPFQTVMGQPAYPIPDDFLREVEEGSLSFYLGGVLVSQGKKRAREDLASTCTCEQFYSLYANQLIIAPVPGQVYDCVWQYYGATDEVVDNNAPVTNLWAIYANMLITMDALEVVASFHVQDPTMAARFAAEARIGKDALWRANEARQHANRDYVIED